jgi:DNA polymerase-3 subunit epsilon
MGYWAWVYVNDDGTISFKEDLPKNKKFSNKLNSVLDDYTLIDIETTGFSNNNDDIIEIAGLKVRNNNVIDNLNLLVRPVTFDFIPNKITNITGITNDMVFNNGYDIEEALKLFLEFLGEDAVVGHNVSFDIGFLRKKVDLYLDCDFNIDYIDTLDLARCKFPNLTSHKLSFLSQVLDLNKKSTHRALDDCYATYELYNLCKDNSNIPIKLQCSSDIDKSTCNYELTDIEGKYFCFTGTLVNMTRDEAINKCTSLGAFITSSVTTKTNYLVMGIQDFAIFSDGKESSKTKKAKKLINDGQDLKIIDENEFIKITSAKLQENV